MGKGIDSRTKKYGLGVLFVSISFISMCSLNFFSELQSPVETEGQRIITDELLQNVMTPSGIMLEVADACPNKIVYGVDANGNQVILGIILQQPLKEEDEDGVLGQILDDVHDENMDAAKWVAAEEEYVSVQGEREKEADVGRQKFSKIESHLSMGRRSQENFPNKCYQVKKSAGKTLAKMKLEVMKKKFGKGEMKPDKLRNTRHRLKVKLVDKRDSIKRSKKNVHDCKDRDFPKLKRKALLNVKGKVFWFDTQF